MSEGKIQAHEVALSSHSVEHIQCYPRIPEGDRHSGTSSQETGNPHALSARRVQIRLKKRLRKKRQGNKSTKS
jgi:hypothetical protein